MSKKFDYSVDRLLRAWKDARVADAHGRRMRLDIIRHYAGPYWAEQTAEENIPLNLLSLYVQVVSRSLIPKAPRFMISTFDRQHLAACRATQDWGNLELRRMKADVTYRRIVIDALSGVGIGRVALATPEDSAKRAWGPQAGQPILSRVDREDWAYDSFSGDLSECGWMGHKYRVPLYAVRDQKNFRSTRKDLQASKPKQYDEYGVEQIGVLGRGFYGNTEYDEMVELWEFYDPRRRLIITFESDTSGSPVAGPDGKPLGEQPWIGPDTGPYYDLGYQWVPGSAMPKGPLQDLFDPALAANQFYRKAIGATERMKEYTVYQNEEDAKRSRDCPDGGTTYVEDPTRVQSVTSGGQQVQAVYGVAQAMRELFDFMGGNLALLGGRAQQASTATQEKMLNQNAQGGIGDMAEATVRFADDVTRGLCWYWWKHPHLVMESGWSVPGVPGEGGVRKVYPRGAADQFGRPRALQRNADFDSLQIEVDAYSLSPSSPQDRLAILRDIWKNDVVPIMPLLQQQGIMPDMHYYFDRLGQLTDNPDFQQLLTVQEPVQGGSTGGQGQPPQPGSTERTYNRVDGSEKTASGQGASQITQLMSGRDQGGSPNGQPQPMGAM